MKTYYAYIFFNRMYLQNNKYANYSAMYMINLVHHITQHKKKLIQKSKISYSKESLPTISRQKVCSMVSNGEIVVKKRKTTISTRRPPLLDFIWHTF